MGNVINFADRLAVKQEKQELEMIQDKFMAEIMPHLTREDKIGILAALDNRDMDAYMEIIKPIIYRNAYRETMRTMNK